MAAQSAHELPRIVKARPALPGRNSIFWPLAALALCVVLQFDVAIHRAINWDEFFHFSQVHQFSQGLLVQPLQTLHARVFAWTLDLPGNSIDQLKAIRLFSVAALLGAGACIYGISRHFADPVTAAICALLYLSAGLVLQHGSSFRADPYLAFFLMASLLLLVRAPLTWFVCAAAGFLCAVATLESIKTVLYAPAFAGVALMRWMDDGLDRRTLIRLTSVGLFAGAFFLLLYGWHSAGLGSESGQVAQGVIHSSSKKMFALGGLPYYDFILKAAMYAVIFAVLTAIAPVLIWRSALPLSRRIALTGLWLPITVVAFYHNTAPYFYVFILPPLAAACVLAVRSATQRYSAMAIAGLLALGTVMVWTLEDRAALAKQSTVIDAAERIFPQPVAYFDTSAMLGHFPKANHFMTPWGQDSYLARHGESFRQTMARIPVPLVIEIEPIFTRALRTNARSPDFLPEDRAALRANYVPFWGPYWVAGKMVRPDTHDEEFLVPGPYTVELGPLEIDGRKLSPGDVIVLDRGMHRLTAYAPSGARLVWGDRLQRPTESAPEPPFWANF